MKKAFFSALLAVMMLFLLVGESRPEYIDTSIVVRQWSSFQEKWNPRPILIVTTLPAVEKSGGNVSRVRLGMELPNAIPEASGVVFPDGISTLSLLPARDAFDELKRQMERKATPGREGTVIDAEIVVQKFLSDRGFVSLPAWRFQLAGGGALVWPALHSQFFWRLGLLSPSSTIMRASASRGQSRITAWMDPGRACGQAEAVHPNVRITESEDVVVISVVKDPRWGGESSRCVMAANYRAKAYTYKLSSPLGDRGLLDELGNVVVVYDGDTAAGPEGLKPTPGRT